MGAIVSEITSPTTVYSTVYSDADQRKHQSSAPLAFVRGIHRGPVTSPHKWPVTRKMLPFDDVIMMSNLSHFRCRPKSRVCKMWKYKISKDVWISHKASIFGCMDGTLIIKVARNLWFAVSNSAPIAHFTSALKTFHDAMGMVGPILANLVRYQPSFSSLWHNYIVKLPQWTKTFLTSGRKWQHSPHCAHFGIACLQSACRIGLSGLNWRHCFRALNRDRCTNACDISPL